MRKNGQDEIDIQTMTADEFMPYAKACFGRERLINYLRVGNRDKNFDSNTDSLEMLRLGPYSFPFFVQHEGQLSPQEQQVLDTGRALSLKARLHIFLDSIYAIEYSSRISPRHLIYSRSLEENTNEVCDTASALSLVLMRYMKWVKRKETDHFILALEINSHECFIDTEEEIFFDHVKMNYEILRYCIGLEHVLCNLIDKQLDMTDPKYCFKTDFIQKRRDLGRILPPNKE